MKNVFGHAAQEQPLEGAVATCSDCDQIGPEGVGSAHDLLAGLPDEDPPLYRSHLILEARRDAVERTLASAGRFDFLVLHRAMSPLLYVPQDRENHGIAIAIAAMTRMFGHTDGALPPQ
jgi:hypothetical protein